MKIESTELGRIVVPDSLPEGFTLFYTTIDFAGDIEDRRLLDLLGGRALISCHQVHGKTVRRAEARPTSGDNIEFAESVRSPHVGRASGRPGECDALYTTDRALALAIKVADCLPVTLLDPPHAVIANIHSGWRGAAQGITAETLDVLARDTTFDARACVAWLGPSICVCCFEVGEEVAAQFDPRWIDRTRGPKPHVDLPALTEALLRERGVANVIDTGLCTRCDGSLFHSYRRDQRAGRNLAIAAR